MANYIKISTIAAKTPTTNPGTSQDAVDQMIHYWQGRFAQVLPDQPDLIVVPECCDRYPAHNAEESQAYYQLRGTQISDYFASVARQHQSYVAYPALRQIEDGSWRNSVQLFDRGGISMGFYNKNFPVIHETTEGGVLCGLDAPIFECDFGRVACAICFDLNFDEIRQKYIDSKPDIILFPSMYHGGLMQNYWAYACRAHLVTAVCGLPSGIISPVGEITATTTNYYDFVSATANLDCQVAHLDGNGDKLRALREKYSAKVSVFDPGHLASVLISSETDEITSAEIVEEFAIELLDDYMERSMAHRRDPQNMEEGLLLPTT